MAHLNQSDFISRYKMQKYKLTLKTAFYFIFVSLREAQDYDYSKIAKIHQCLINFTSFDVIGHGKDKNFI